eukprot:CAMPEP_0197030948 /NCGR_PEP_ID=MMETSP1384-20130603/10068_1 /TAXON_ID=29189 /ORGANISM="Ammonia sp." /LENGTH=379 /DNA_ID=CAMNT_0042460389 /DNA_START=57 /DNA_END=1196 /DNA_ORIENTATION=+
MALVTVLFVTLFARRTASNSVNGLECDTEETFNFDEWVIDYGLSEIKPLLIEYNATTLDVLTLRSPTMEQLMSDPRLLDKEHMLPVIMKALADNVIHIIVSEEENRVATEIDEHLASLASMRQKVKELSVQYPVSKQVVDEQNVQHMAHTKAQINEVFDILTEQMNRRRQLLLDELDFTEREEHNVSVTLLDCLVSIKSLEKFLSQKERAYHRLIFTHLDEDRATRKREILKMGQLIENEYGETNLMLQAKLFEVEEKIEKNRKYTPQLRFVIDERLYSSMLAAIKQFGIIDTQRNSVLVDGVVSEQQSGKKQPGDAHVEQSKKGKDTSSRRGSKWASSENPILRTGFAVFVVFAVLTVLGCIALYFMDRIFDRKQSPQ